VGNRQDAASLSGLIRRTHSRVLRKPLLRVTCTSPALYSEQRLAKDACLGSLVTWADVDRRAAQEPSCGLLVASGSPGHLHAYWPSTELLSVDTTEAWNYWHVLQEQADSGGWDATQLLRVPGTLNHKKDPPTPVELLRYSDEHYEPPPELSSLRVPRYVKPDILPTFETVTQEHREHDPAISEVLLQDYRAEGFDRSGALFNLACLLSERDYTATEAFVILRKLDETWGKFRDRPDGDRRLEQLVEVAYAKTLPTAVGALKTGTTQVLHPRAPFRVVGFKSLAKDLPDIQWLVDNTVKPGGQVMLVSQPGVGKSQMAIDLSIRLVLGKSDWVGHKIDTSGIPQKVLYLSLEMTELDVRYFTDKMSYLLPQDELERLDKNFLFHCTIENFKLDVEANNGLSARGPIEATLQDAGYTGLVIDSLRATTSKGLLDDIAVRNTMDWVKTLRSRFGIWVLILAHTRKIPRDARRGVLTLDDIFGSQIQQADLDAAFALVKVEGMEGYLDLYSLKARFGPDKKPIRLLRNAQLILEKSNQSVEVPNGRNSTPELIDDAHDGIDWTENE